jgi:hypothetical protein
MMIAQPIVAVVVDAIAIADIEPVLGAIPPDGALHKSRKCRREDGVKLTSVDMCRR